MTDGKEEGDESSKRAYQLSLASCLHGSVSDEKVCFEWLGKCDAIDPGGGRRIISSHSARSSVYGPPRLLTCSLATHQKLPFDDALPW